MKERKHEIENADRLHDFAEIVSKMMRAQHDESIFNARITYKANSGVKIEEEEYAKHNELILQMYEYELQVRAWIKENYPQLMEERHGTTELQD